MNYEMSHEAEGNCRIVWPVEWLFHIYMYTHTLWVIDFSLTSSLREDFEFPVQCLSCACCALLDREFLVCSWDLLEPQLKGHSPECFYPHWDHSGLHFPYPLQFLFLQLLMLLLDAPAMLWPLPPQSDFPSSITSDTCRWCSPWRVLLGMP